MARPEARPAIQKARDAAAHPAAPTAAGPAEAAPLPATGGSAKRVRRLNHSTRVDVEVLDRLDRYLSSLPREQQRGLIQRLTERGLTLALDEAGAPR